MDVIVEKKEYHVRNLPTRTVTLFPARAQPGTNEVTIIGLTPTVDESTIKVEGTGSAVISDIAIELLPNRDIFEDVYPDDDSDVDDESDFYDSDDEIPDSPELESVRAKLLELEDEQRQAKETVESASTRLGFLDAYGKSLDKKPSVDLVETMSAYRAEREKVYQDRATGLRRQREIAKLLAAARKELNRLEKLKRKQSRPLERERKIAQKKRNKEHEKLLRKRQEAWKEKERVRKERERFWPKVCYSVRVTLEAHTFTPMSSRRTSVSSDTAQVFNPSAESETETPLSCDLSLTYVTSAASWEPSYDLQLSTTNNTATLCYDASITNETSETWTNCKVILSTSQTTFSGLEEEIPELKPWKIMLGPKMGSGIGGQSILNSREERLQRETWRKAQKKTENPVDRERLFGVERDYAFACAAAVCEEGEESDGDMGFFLEDDGGQDGSRPRGIQEIAVAPPMARKAQRSMVGRLGSAVAYGVASASRRKESPGGGGGESSEEYNYPLQDPREAALDFEESTIEETGFTTTYDLPGNKTLPPRPTASKQRVARLSFSNVAFSHTVVAKYKPAAFLKAKIRNGSRLTLLKGAAGLTLDGTFMGRTSLPRCSAGDTFTLGLGVDPAIMVTYPVAAVRRATTGFFSKDNSSVYTRSINVANTRAAAGKPVSLLVVDQVPVSEDERLKVDILDPKGMAIGGAGVPGGLPGRSDKEDVDWGKAVSNLKKDGQVEWEVTLNAGKAVKLGLEYVVAMPSGDSATEC